MRIRNALKNLSRMPGELRREMKGVMTRPEEADTMNATGLITSDHNMLLTVVCRFVLRVFEFLRRRLPHHLRRAWGAEDEFAWRRFPFLEGREVTVKNSLDQKLLVRLDSLGDLYAAFGREAERGVREVLTGLRPGDIVLDIGAHIGGYSLTAAQAVGPNGRVFAFEPVSANKERLELNARINGIDWLIPVQAAVGRKKGYVERLVSDVDSMWASTRSAWSETLHHGSARAHVMSQQVPMITVDNFLREQGISSVSLMKIDVEGAEMDVLAGAASALAEGRIQQIIVEVHSPPAKWKDVGALLNRYGYEVRDLGGYEMHGVLKPRLQQQKQGRLTTKRPTTVALIGCGAVSTILHTPALDSLASEGLVETVALVDPDPDRTSAIGKTLSGARQYRDVDAMLADITPDMAIIATPHRLHAPLTVSCVESGIHVLCEKPMATDTAACDRMIESAEKAGRVLAVGHFRRSFPSGKLMKLILESQVLGPVRSFRFLEGETYSWPAQSASFFKRADSGGGVLIDAGAHTMDFLLWWLGDVAEVRYQDDAMGGIEANCQIHLRMASGATGIVQLSQDWPLPNRYLIDCEKGWIAYTYDVVARVEWGLHHSEYGLQAEIRAMAAGSRNGMRELGAAMPGFMECFAAQLRNFVAAIHGAEPLQVSPREARKVVALIEQCYRSRAPLEMPWLDEGERQRARELAYG